MYYFYMLDCNKNFPRQFEKKTNPKILTKVTLLNMEPEESHFTYEDTGILSLYTYLFLGTIIVVGYVIQNYIKFATTFERYLSPHPLMLTALGFQSLSLFFALVH